MPEPNEVGPNSGAAKGQARGRDGARGHGAVSELRAAYRTPIPGAPLRLQPINQAS